MPIKLEVTGVDIADFAHHLAGVCALFNLPIGVNEVPIPGPNVVPEAEKLAAMEAEVDEANKPKRRGRPPKTEPEQTDIEEVIADVRCPGMA